ncbi:cytochrome c3 family protein, partial [bacterium]|nr:cytochrome c3 family protein [bacterium]
MNFQNHQTFYRQGWLFIFICLVLTAALFPSNELSAQIKRGKRFSKRGACLDCHEKSEYRGRYSHSPAKKGECLSCHKPHGQVGALRLKETKSQLCALCHDLEKLALNKAFVHEPARKGDCTVCHNPHRGEAPGMLKTPLPELCME